MSRDDGTRTAPGRCDAVVVGAGFAGMYALHRLRDDLGLSVRVFEKGGAVGGTWYWNRYPGARCDAESVFYSYSFDEELQQEWVWSERFATQPEILRYAHHVAERFDLERDITFETAVTAAHYDEDGHVWRVETDRGERVEARYLVTAVGCLSAAQSPQIEGLDTFQGTTLHTAAWPHEGADLAGKRVAVIGTGSSAIQTIPEIARQAAHVTVFQRTPNYSVPAHNRAFSPEEFAEIQAQYPKLREQARATPVGMAMGAPAGSAHELTDAQRRAELDRRWSEGGLGFMSAFSDCMTDRAANDVAAEYVRTRIREIVADPATAELLCPTDYPIGTKRICVDTDYYATYNRDNVSLVSIRKSPIERITPQGVRVAGTTHTADVIVFATGFDAMTGPYTRMDIRGRDGVPIAQKWGEGPRTYLGVATAGFPNMFMITAPGSPSVLTNMIASIEQHVDWITDYLRHLDGEGVGATEPALDAEDAWVDHVNQAASMTLYPQAGSWYMGANVPGKSRVFMPYVGGLDNYRHKCDEIAADDYPGFVHTD